MNLDEAIRTILKHGSLPIDEEARVRNLRRKPLVDMDEDELDCLAEQSRNAQFRDLRE